MAVTIRKMIENAARMIVSAISLGVFCRDRPLDQGDHPVEEALAGARR